MASDTKEVVTDLAPVLRVYKDGKVERLVGSAYVPPSPNHPATGVSSKDAAISPLISARLYLPKTTTTTPQKLPILIYFHGGGFCVESAFSFLDHRYMNQIASQAKVLIISVEYRLAPEYLLPVAYEDCWDAIQWVASHAVSVNDDGENKELWLINHGDFEKVFIGGDSAGGNIVHNIAVRAGIESFNGDLKILGAFLSCPYFWGSKPLGSESSESREPSMLYMSESREQSLLYRMWMCAYPSAPGGIDNPMINPLADDAPSLSGLGCSKVLVCVAGKDPLRDRGVHYVEAVKGSGWTGEVEVFEVEGEDHCFHIINPDSENAKNLIKRLASFISQ
ncbi:unnamed protein product [Ilex paraguariensis]|uniref:Alpha/beta hydrolase fold-3 domain-containing protein n=1 Tax=Ilex paraguariensis TaxID=185542 RepID=A0ABC8TVX1_9AQUA